MCGEFAEQRLTLWDPFLLLIILTLVAHCTACTRHVCYVPCAVQNISLPNYSVCIVHRQGLDTLHVSHTHYIIFSIYNLWEPC